ncbi:MAG: TfoX/Sxy family protein [Acidobacteria bacterium]|nr:TfoX/Sxy family protein [Acidobacteriota bacterium]
MAFSEKLADRIRKQLESETGIVEKKMFGGLAFMVNGNMSCGVVGDDLMVRVGPDAYAEALAEPDAREMDFTGRPMKGMIYVTADGICTAKRLAFWVKKGLRFAQSLPAK